MYVANCTNSMKVAFQKHEHVIECEEGLNTLVEQDIDKNVQFVAAEVLKCIGLF